MWYSSRTSSSFFSIAIILLSQQWSLVHCVSPLTTLFRTPASGQPGSCDVSKINAMISETEAYARAAVDTIKAYKAQILSAPANTQVVNTWRTAYVLFRVEGSQYQDQLGTHVQIKDAANVAILDDYAANFARIVTMLNSSTVLAGGNALFVCDDSVFRYAVTLSDIGIGQPDSSPGSTTITQDYINKGQLPKTDTTPGWYHYDTCGLTGNWEDEGIEDENGNPGGSLCKGTGLGNGGWITSPSTNMILMCPEVWEGRLASLAPYLSGQQNIPIGEHIKEMQSVPSTFLHELMHFLGDNTATGKPIEDQDVEDEPAYGWELSSLLAQHDPELAKNNADQYQYFGIQSYMPLINWGIDGYREIVYVQHKEIAGESSNLRNTSSQLSR